MPIRGDHDVGDEVVVATEDTFWVPVLVLVTGELPDDDCLVYTLVWSITKCGVYDLYGRTTGGGQNDIGGLRRGGNGCNPASMTGQRTKEAERFSHSVVDELGVVVVVGRWFAMPE